MKRRRNLAANVSCVQSMQTRPAGAICGKTESSLSNKNPANMKRELEWTEEDGWTVYLNGGRVDTGRDAVEWAKEAERLGAGEILLTSMDCDGVKTDMIWN